MGDSEFERMPEAARQKTRDFLGPEDQWSGAVMTVKRHTTYGLGSCEIEIRGDGNAVIRAETFESPPQRREHQLQLGKDIATHLLRAFVDQAFTEIVISEHSGVPDELYYTMVLANSRGDKHELGKFVRTEHQRFDLLNRLVGEAVIKKLRKRDRKKLNL